jgi:hypothetical protein
MSEFGGPEAAIDNMLAKKKPTVYNGGDHRTMPPPIPIQWKGYGEDYTAGTPSASAAGPQQYPIVQQ